MEHDHSRTPFRIADALHQQLDGDLLAPIVYGRALQLHPLIVLFSVVAGGALFGIAGTILAVPLTAMAVAMGAEAGLVRPVPGAEDLEPFAEDDATPDDPADANDS